MVKATEVSTQHNKGGRYSIMSMNLRKEKKEAIWRREGYELRYHNYRDRMIHRALFTGGVWTLFMDLLQNIMSLIIFNINL